MKRILMLAMAALPAMMAKAESYTWTGATDYDFHTATNWTPEGIPGETDEAEIDGAAVTVSGRHRLPASLKLKNGASYTVLDDELHFGGTIDHTIYGGTVSCTLVAAQSNVQLSISDCHIIDSGTGNNGFWKIDDSCLNFVDGDARAAKFTYQTSIAIDPFFFFERMYIRYKGEVLDRAGYDENFTSRDNGNGTTTLSLIPDTPWRILENAAVVTKDSATISATVKKCASGNGIVYYVFKSTRAEVESALANAASMTSTETAAVVDDVVSVSLSDLTEDATYYYAFAIIDAGQVVATTEPTAVVPSDYDNIYVNSAWTKGAPIPGQRLLFKEPFSIPQSGWNEKTFAAFTIDVGYGNIVHIEGYTGVTLSGALMLKSGTVTVDPTSFIHYSKLIMDGGSFVTGGQDFNDASAATLFEFRGGTLELTGECKTGGKVSLTNMVIFAPNFITGDAATTAHATRVVSTRRDRRVDLPFGFYGQHHYLDFTPGAVADNVIPPSCGYGWTYDYPTEEGETVDWPARTDEQILQVLFTEGRITLNGDAVSDATFAAQFVVYDDTADHSQLVTMFTPFGAATKGAYTLMNGAVVRLAERTTLSGLTIEGTDTIIDLNGKILSVTSKNAFVLNGNVVVRGDYTPAQLNTLAGAEIFRGTGSISVGKSGLAVFVR